MNRELILKLEQFSVAYKAKEEKLSNVKSTKGIVPNYIVLDEVEKPIEPAVPTNDIKLHVVTEYQCREFNPKKDCEPFKFNILDKSTFKFLIPGIVLFIICLIIAFEFYTPLIIVGLILLGVMILLAFKSQRKDNKKVNENLRALFAENEVKNKNKHDLEQQRLLEESKDKIEQQRIYKENYPALLSVYKEECIRYEKAVEERNKLIKENRFSEDNRVAAEKTFIEEKNKRIIEEAVTTFEKELKIIDIDFPEFYYKDIDDLLKLVKNGRADSIKEAINLFEHIKIEEARLAESKRAADAAEEARYEAEMANQEDYYRVFYRYWSCGSTRESYEDVRASSAAEAMAQVEGSYRAKKFD